METDPYFSCKNTEFISINPKTPLAQTLTARWHLFCLCLYNKLGTFVCLAIICRDPNPMSNTTEYKTILYATDLGKHTRPVFRHAVQLAKQYNAQIVMLHALKPLGATGRSVIHTYSPDLDLSSMEHDGMKEVIKQMQARLEEFCKEESDACEDGSTLVHDLCVRGGMPPEVILKAATDYNADVIVMGACTHSFLGHHSLGSTARKVTLHAKVPVLIIPNA